MAHVAIIETYPYEAVWGGDAVYLDGIRAYLMRCEHRVDSLVTDMTRGRSNPRIRLPAPAAGNHRWKVRRAMQLGEGRFYSLDPRLLGKALRRLPGGRAPIEQDIEEAEVEWVLAHIKQSMPDLAILAFGACAMSAAVRGLGVEVLALKGFFSDRRIRLGEQMPTPTVGRALLDTLREASRVGFNNLHDLDHYAELSGHTNGVFVGMGFPERLQPAPDGEPVLVFVGARTQPNIESLRWFLDQVWPAILYGRPDARLRVVGSISAAFSNDPRAGVAFLGFVDRLDAEYRGAALAVAPLVNGSSGIKTKIAEALSFARPVVTTSLGVEPDWPDQYGEAVVVADDPAAFAQAVCALLDDSEGRVAEAADQYRRHFAEDAAYQEIFALLPSAAREPRVVSA